MFRFENPDLLYFLFAVPLIFLLFWYSRHIRIRNIKRIGDNALVKRLMKHYSPQRIFWKHIFTIIAITLLIFALANPQFGSKLKEVKQEGIEIMVALDVSRSMEARDITPDRLKRAKRSIEGFIDDLQGDMIGMVVFAGHAYIQIPMTSDYASAKMYLDNIDTDIVPTQGTSIADAIDMSMKAFSPDPEPAKVIVLITDGEDHSNEAVEAAKLAAKEGAKVYCVGMGTSEGAPVPGDNGGFHRNKDGEVVISKLNEDVLAAIADAGNGKYVLAGKSGTGLDVILDEISGLSKKEREVEVYSEFDDQYQYPLALAIILLILESLISRRKEYTIDKLKRNKS